MPAPIDDVVKRRVVQQWLAGEPREKIIADNNIAAGTVSIIVDDYKAGLDNFNLDSFRELTLEAKKRGMTPNDLASFFRLYNFFRSTRAKENEVESFITNINSGYLPPGKAIELINQIYEISKSESVPPDQLPNYVRQKLEEKQKIDAILQSKNINIQAINEYIALNEKLKEHGISTQDIDKLKNLLVNAKEYGFDPRLIVRKLRNIKRLENKEGRLRNNCEVLSKKLTKYKEMLPLAELVQSMNVSGSELISFKGAVNEAAEQYGFPRSTAAAYVLNNIRDYNKIGGVKKELSKVTTQVVCVNEACFRQNKAMMAMLNLQSRGITEEQILQVSNFLEKNGYKIPINR
jgi:hypothetical protein